MAVTIDGLVFQSSNYDADGDVLYLSRGESRVTADGLLTSEGHGVRFGPDGEVIGVNGRFLAPETLVLFGPGRWLHEP